MRRGVLLLSVGVVLVGTTSAQATTVIDPASPNAAMYQRWADGAKVPTPDVTVRVYEAPCPDAPVAAGCASVASNEMYLVDMGVASRIVFLHELGHFFDVLHLEDSDREAFAGLIDRPARPWLPHSRPSVSGERFASTYAYCAVRKERPARWRYTARYTAYEHYARACAVIRLAD